MHPKLPRKMRPAVRRPDGHYRAHIATVYYISRPPLSQNPPSAPALCLKKHNQQGYGGWGCCLWRCLHYSGQLIMSYYSLVSINTCSHCLEGFFRPRFSFRAAESLTYEPQMKKPYTETYRSMGCDQNGYPKIRLSSSLKIHDRSHKIRHCLHNCLLF